MIKKFSTTILWGKSPEPDAEPVKYEFDTQRELDAFIHGINESDGWMGCHEIDATKNHVVLGGCVYEFDTQEELNAFVKENGYEG